MQQFDLWIWNPESITTFKVSDFGILIYVYFHKIQLDIIEFKWHDHDIIKLTIIMIIIIIDYFGYETVRNQPKKKMNQHWKTVKSFDFYGLTHGRANDLFLHQNYKLKKHGIGLIWEFQKCHFGFSNKFSIPFGNFSMDSTRLVVGFKPNVRSQRWSPRMFARW